MLSLIKKWRGAQQPKNWDAEARVIEKAEIRKFLDDRGILIFNARMNGGFVNEALAREVQNEYFRDASRPSKLAIIGQVLFG